MLRDKDISKVQEIKIFFKDNWTLPSFLEDQLKIFHLSKASKIFKSVKSSGVPFWEVFNLLLILPFTMATSINSIYHDKLSPTAKGKKDVYYRAMTNQKLNWRSILFLFVKHYLSLEPNFSKPKDDVKCLIFDDTSIAKTGKKIEGVSKVFDHVSHGYILGFKLLVAGYWNGSVFIPVDFSFHRESKKSKSGNYGLTPKESRKQKKHERDKLLPTAKRFLELNMKKSDMVIQMFKRVNQRRIHVDYILIDSWFTTMELISKFLTINKNVHVIGMYKYNSKVEMDNKEFTIKQLRNLKPKLKRSRKHKFYYHDFTGKIDGISVKIFIVKRGRNGAWHTMLSTDTSLGFVRMIEIYHTRWAIEVFFKEVKQLLGLGKNQSTNFDVQVAQTTITMIQYLLISLKFRQQAYETLNGLFKDLKQEYVEQKLNERILMAIVEILAVLDFLIKDFDFDDTLTKLIDYADDPQFIKNIQNMINLYKSVA